MRRKHVSSMAEVMKVSEAMMVGSSVCRLPWWLLISVGMVDMAMSW